MKKIFLTLIVWIGLGHINTQGQIEKFKAAFIYNFAKNMEWPSQYKTGDFIIGVLGKTPVTSELKKLEGTRTIGAQKIKIKVFSNPSQITRCHILYIPKNANKNFSPAIKKVDKTLIVVDDAKLIDSGAGIGFVMKNNKLRFKLNKSNIEKRQLKVSSTLINLSL